MDEPLDREIERLEHRVPSVADELVTIRRGLGKGERRVELDNIKLSFACKQRWDDMTGDDRVRVCHGCDRPVFNLSEMTRVEAEALLATRGITPCVRFYRRPDGTVMTSDCPTRPRSNRLAMVAAGATLAIAPAAMADSPQHADDTERPDDGSDGSGSGSGTELLPNITDSTKDLIGIFGPEGDALTGALVDNPAERPAIEWSLWGRLGIGLTSHPSDLTARSTTTEPPSMSSTATFVAAATADVTFGFADDGNLRVGAWGELRTTSGPVGGGELVIEELSSLVHARGGSGSLVLRLGANADIITGELGVGYVGTWNPPTIRWLRHVAGAHAVLSVDRTIDTHEWSATLGVEADPIGLLHALYDLVTDD
jgi:hypothetical protein